MKLSRSSSKFTLTGVSSLLRKTFGDLQDFEDSRGASLQHSQGRYHKFIKLQNITRFLENLLHLAVIFHLLKLLPGIVRITTCGCFLVIHRPLLLAAGCISRNILVSAGGLAGICSWVTTYPQDVIKSRVQGDGWGPHQRYQGPRHCLRVRVVMKIHLNTLLVYNQSSV